MENKIGQGFDVHKLEVGTPLVIGGVSIPYDKGSVGHSDGDVLYHAIVDACLGAVAERDIGQHFPSSDSKWKNANSMIFLENVSEKVKSAGFRINHIDSVIILQKPNLSQYIITMRSNIANTIKIDKSQISIKATTTDYIGDIGKGNAIAAQAITTLEN